MMQSCVGANIGAESCLVCKSGYGITALAAKAVIGRESIYAHSCEDSVCVKAQFSRKAQYPFRARADTWHKRTFAIPPKQQGLPRRGSPCKFVRALL